MVCTGQTVSDVGLAIARVDYHGWRDCYVVTNGIVEAVVVPAIGRVMQFRIAGEYGGLFWQNRALDGRPAKHGSEWINFGGDKAWPAPQGDWERVAGQPWPPPAAFDSMPVDASVHEHELILTSTVDEHYGIEVLRHIILIPDSPVMNIRTRYRKVSGAPVNVGVWIITQLGDARRAFAALHEGSQPSSGYTQLTGPAPQDIRRDGRLLSFRRDPNHNLKIAIQGNSLAWMDDEYVLRIDGHAASGTDNSCSTSVYTNRDPLPYIELETEGPVTLLATGDQIELTNIYTLTRRSLQDATAEAKKIFGL